MYNEKTDISHFEKIRKLGEGSFAKVYMVKRKIDQKFYALKQVKLGTIKKKQRENALNEIRILASNQGENIVGYKEAFVDETANTLCIIMEFAEEGDLQKKIQSHIKKQTKFQEEEIWKALQHMSIGLKSLHQKKILHRDIKAANVFIFNNGTYKLGDLNVSKVLQKEMAQTQIGTPYYASPEVWKDKPYGVKSDIWSLGCVIYEMASLKHPFPASDVQTLYRKVCHGSYQKISSKYSSDLSSIISILLKVNPKDRPSIQELLENPIVKKRCEGILEKKTEQSRNLLKTIKFDDKNILEFQKCLPKANYDKQKINIEDLRGGVMSCKNTRKINEQREDLSFKEFIKKKRQETKEEKERSLKALQEEKQELARKRERSLTVGERRENSENDSLISNKNTSSEEKNANIPKLPPLNKISNVYDYKLPPKPSNRMSIRQLNRKNEVSYVNRDSKENLKKMGERILSLENRIEEKVKSGKRERRIVYPDWYN